MKKLILSILLVGLALPSVAIQPYVRSFLNPGVGSLFITNAGGATNLLSVAQAGSQGRYLIGTNAVQGSIYGFIATNYYFTKYTNSQPNYTNGVNLPMLVIVTNNVAAGYSTNNGAMMQVSPGTNGALPGLGGGANLFQDVPISPSYHFPYSENAWMQGAAGATNSLGLLTIVSQPDISSGLPLGAGGGSNNIVVTLVGVPNQLGGIAPGTTPVGLSPNLGSPQASYGLEATDGAGGAGSEGLQSWSITYTNQIATLGQVTVFATPVPAWPFAGCQAIRCRSVVSVGGTTNNTWILSMSLTGNVP